MKALQQAKELERKKKKNVRQENYITGCRSSVIFFFSAAMNLVVKSAEKQCTGPLMAGIKQTQGKA